MIIATILIGSIVAGMATTSLLHSYKTRRDLGLVGGALFAWLYNVIAGNPSTENA
jgi:hypothetical protein